MNKKLKRYKGRRSEKWTPEGADFEFEFREPSGAFIDQMSEHNQENDKKKKLTKKQKTKKDESAGVALFIEVVYIDGEKAFDDAADVKEFFKVQGASVIKEMTERARNICGITKKQIEEAEKK